MRAWLRHFGRDLRLYGELDHHKNHGVGAILMDISLIRSRYKVTGVIRTEENYTAYRAVNIERGDVREYLVNVYEGVYARRYAGCFDLLRHCREFCEVFIEYGVLVAVFSYTEGPDIDVMLRQCEPASWRERVEYARLLFRLALSVADYPEEVARAAFYSENLIPLPKEARLTVNFAVRPAEGDEQTIIELMTLQVKKALRPHFSSPSAELDFIEELTSRRWSGIVQLCSHWQDAELQIIEEYEALDAMNAPGRMIKIIMAKLKRSFAKMKQKKVGVR
jgi:hypothetical protein